jgi:hypothetical protein
VDAEVFFVISETADSGAGQFVFAFD